MVNKIKEAVDKVDQQLATELYYSKEAVDNRIIGIIENDQDILDNIDKAVQNIELWALMFDGYESKRNRLDAFIENNDIYDVVKKALVIVMKLVDRKDLISSISGQVAGLIKGMDNKRHQVITAAEILAMMDKADLIFIEDGANQYETKNGEVYDITSKYVINPWEIDNGTKDHIRRSMYPLPMIIAPQKLYRNDHSVYLNTHSDSLILGKGNYHNKRISLDVLNKLNAVEFSINTDMMLYLTEDLLLDEEKLQKMKEDPKRREQYDVLMEQSAFALAYLVKNGNKFHIGHKFDKRGRTYCQAYHVSYQSNAFRKSIVDLAKKEYIEPDFS